VYLDHTGAGLYPASLVARHAQMLADEVLGNPHSGNPTSVRSTVLFEGARERVLSFFNAAPDEFAVVFTANATHALKLVGESYPFGEGGRLLLTADNHNSVLGIREFARRGGVSAEYVPILPPDMRADEPALLHALDAPGGAHRLFAYPVQSNFSGVQHPLEWIERAQARGWDVLLDAAAFVPTNRLDLGRWHPDYVVLSFYKMFGYPTGVGALLARHSALERLRRPWFAGGTITVASVQADRHYLAPGGTGFEDGTVNFLAVPAVGMGLSFVQSVGVEAIHRHVQALTVPLLEALLPLRHRNGRRVVALYGPDDVERRGATLAFNFVNPEGQVIEPALVERLAGTDGISLRTGCFCNPGAGEAALGLSRTELEACFRRNPERMSPGTAAVRCGCPWGSPATGPTSRPWPPSPADSRTPITARWPERPRRTGRPMEFLNLLTIFAAGWIVFRRPERERLAFRLLVASVVMMVALFCLATRTSLLPGVNY
jgi:selenocysteine lyase/cysteine desulfurase